MRNSRLDFAVLAIFALLLSMTVGRAMSQEAKFAGTWELTMAASEQGAEGGHHGGRGGGAQSLTITQDGEKYKVSHKTHRGENAYDATVSGNTISWTEEHEGRGGNTMKVNYKATLDGDTLKGTMSGGQFSRDFTAKRTS
jgi:hypothetical protein